MTYERSDLCVVVALAFEHLMQLEKKAKTIKQKEKLAAQLVAFNKTIFGLKITFEELPLEIHAKAAKFVDGKPGEKSARGEKPTLGPSDA